VLRALVTGGAGFIGRYSRRRLLFEGYKVDTFDLRSFSVDKKHRSESGWVMNALDFFHGDRTTYDVVVHAAAFVGGREKIDGEPHKMGINFELDAAYINWVVKTRPKHAVYLASSAVYPIDLQTGRPPYRLRETDLDVDHIRTPDQTYGMAKLAGEHLVQRARRAGANVHVLRPFSGYGTDQDDTYPFPALIRRVRARQQPFEIWGDATQVRDWVHIDDIMGCMMAVIENDYPDPLNVCTGRATSFIEFAQLAHELDGRPMPQMRLMTDKPTGVMFRVADPTAMLKLYEPKVTLEEGIRRALART
jgi:nucleoside-diphosphate-sugar epimerase